MQCLCLWIWGVFPGLSSGEGHSLAYVHATPFLTSANLRQHSHPQPHPVNRPPGEHESLLARDQLLHAMRSGVAFGGWQEAAIRFPPTFKFKRGSPRYLGQEVEGSATPGTSAAGTLACRVAEEGMGTASPPNEVPDGC